MSNDQKAAVSARLSESGIQFSATLRGETTRDNGGNGKWVCDEWFIKFERYGVDALEFPYYMGTGHRKSAKAMPADIAKLGRNILARVEWEKHNLKPTSPDAADVLYSLILDADSTDCGFDEWCDSFGYDADSIKALRTFDECRESARKLRQFFSQSELKALRDALEDY